MSSREVGPLRLDWPLSRLDPVRVFLLTDSHHVERRLPLGGSGVGGKHADLWTVVRRGTHKDPAVRWVKAEAAARGIPHSR